MTEGQLKSSNRSGCLMYLALIYAFPMLAALAVLPLGVVYLLSLIHISEPTRPY